MSRTIEVSHIILHPVQRIKLIAQNEGCTVEEFWASNRGAPPIAQGVAVSEGDLLFTRDYPELRGYVHPAVSMDIMKTYLADYKLWRKAERLTDDEDDGTTEHDDYDDYDGQPDWAQEWHDFDPDC